MQHVYRRGVFRILFKEKHVIVQHVYRRGVFRILFKEKHVIDKCLVNRLIDNFMKRSETPDFIYKSMADE